eukprot:CAMPEP_0197251952 /NCGR_PEP_ID=MMETSP1429-20130617/59267_1 /TAXON_ID=49237 /ORGANISM="Chaetoceros  sp., Strain UNC1202" /LENGTH=57 /DNA_ID=CAMNT_0042714183 /DNA_START=32 /DNA_END=201 /DNA_ORIENTATION=+
MTDIVEDKLAVVQLGQEQNNDRTSELSRVLTEMTKNIQRAQQQEIERQLEEIERKLV